MHTFRYNWTTMRRILQVPNSVSIVKSCTNVHISRIRSILLYYLSRSKTISSFTYISNKSKQGKEREREREKIYYTSKSLDFTPCGSTICMIQSRNLFININFYEFFKRTVYILIAFGNSILLQNVWSRGR